jgi:hypothetical protein
MAQQNGSANKDTIIFLKAYSKIVPDFLARSSTTIALTYFQFCSYHSVM